MDPRGMRFDQKKRGIFRAVRMPRDKGNGMDSATQRHFDNVKRKMFEFIHRPDQAELNGRILAPPQHHHHRFPRSPEVFDKKKEPNQRIHHHSPAVGHKKFLRHPAQIPVHKQLQHLALATPQVVRRRM